MTSCWQHEYRCLSPTICPYFIHSSLWVFLTASSIHSEVMYVVPSISFQTYFVHAFKIVIDSWKFSMLLLYILWYDWPIFMISASNEKIQQEFEYTLLKPDCHSWWISKIQSRHENTSEERYAINFCFKLGKNATEMYAYLPTPPLGQDMTQGQFLSGV